MLEIQIVAPIAEVGADGKALTVTVIVLLVEDIHPDVVLRDSA